jgi:hypothetical protein
MIAELRNLDDDLVNSPQALRLRTRDAVLKRLQNILDRVGDQDTRELEFTRKDLDKRIRNWLGWAGYYPQASYGCGMWFDRGRDRMLRQPTAPGGEADGLEPAPNSMRTVEPETGFFLRLVGSRRNQPAAKPQEE